MIGIRIFRFKVARSTQRDQHFQFVEQVRVLIVIWHYTPYWFWQNTVYPVVESGQSKSNLQPLIPGGQDYSQA